MCLRWPVLPGRIGRLRDIMHRLATLSCDVLQRWASKSLMLWGECPEQTGETALCRCVIGRFAA